MVNCAVLSCKSKSSGKVAGPENGDISYHRFPDDPKLKTKWIEATGRKNWLPTKNSTICSLHFHEDSFSSTKKFRRLINSAYPTIQIVVISSDEQHIEEQHASTDYKICTPKERRILRKLNNSKQAIMEKDKLIKRLREQNRRKDKKIKTLMEMLFYLKKTLIKDSQES